MVLGIWSFLLIIVANVVCGNDDESLEIPGCIDLDALPNNLAKLENDQIAKLRCLCSSSKRMDMYGQLGVSIMCIYGSRLEDVRQSMLAVNEANRTIHRISINHMAIDETFNETFIDFPLHELQQFEIRSCHGSPVNLSYLIPTTTSLKSLTEITVEDCQLEEMPSELLKRSYNLKVLNLRKNKIIHIKKYELEEVAKSLEVLDLSGNLLAEMEPDSIGQLKSLNKLIIGEHNSVKNLANDLGKLMEIRTLDLTRIDGLDDLSKINFTQTKKLENLILTGCNIKSINRSHLNGLANLKKLDLRVNLLEAIEEGSFAQMHNLNYLSLAGNFLQESTFGPKLWDGLHSLQFLDIGWNEVTQISSQFFKNLHKSLRALDLSHNEKLSKIDENAFGKMVQLARLNLNGCGLKNITKEMFRGMTHLTELDLSFNKIEFIDSLAFEEQTSHLQQLSLDENRLKYLNITFLENLPNLTEIDISGNPWICDENGKSIAEWIRNKYRVAAEKNLDFLLKNSEKTVCARPYKLKGQPLLDVEEEDFEENFDESLDTTTLESTSTTTAEDEEQAKKSTLNFENIFVFVGNSSSNETVKDADIGKPKYDINSIRYGTDRPKESSNDWVSLVTVGVLVIATIIGVTLVIKRKKENSKNQSMNETGMM